MSDRTSAARRWGDSVRELLNRGEGSADNASMPPRSKASALARVLSAPKVFKRQFRSLTRTHTGPASAQAAFVLALRFVRQRDHD